MNGSANIAQLELAATHLGDIIQEVAFVGGATVALMITDEAAPDVRPTIDVDVIVEIGSVIGYHKLTERLKDKGFSVDSSEDAPTCRFRGHDLILDVMPTDPNILGYSNRWYSEALTQSKVVRLPSGAEILVVSALYFVATKLEAFADRGHGDYLASHDFEDIMAVVDGREELAEELAAIDNAMADYIRSAFTEFLADQNFLDALPGCLSADVASQQRVSVLEKRVRAIAGH
ncbi:MAG: hypothetical protein KBT87_07465 [Gammaproteobacteria bacterium]|nr:hypothetical protein [Gammaproteobacteria bacterium]MBQ0774490.1 hypothetical protein [Gammaproteobacteria bacterium]